MEKNSAPKERVKTEVGKVVVPRGRDSSATKTVNLGKGQRADCK